MEPKHAEPNQVSIGVLFDNLILVFSAQSTQSSLATSWPQRRQAPIHVGIPDYRVGIQKIKDTAQSDFLHICPFKLFNPSVSFFFKKQFMAEVTDANQPEKSGKFPHSIWYIVGNEAAERFNFYGMTAILTTFLIAQFYNPTESTDPAVVSVAEATANAKTHDFKAMAYLLPMFGGMIADWFWGKYKTILYLSVVYALGSTLLALSVDSEVMFTSALLIIAIGTGGIKPCVSANVGDQFDASNQHLLPKAFDAFYASINAGSVLSILLIPYLNKHFGPAVAFGVPAIAMIIAVIFFWAGRNTYRKIPLPTFDPNRLTIFVTAFVSLLLSYLYFDTLPIMAANQIKATGSSSLAGLYPFVADKTTLSSFGTGPILGVWAILVIILAFVFKKQWFANPGNFVGINLYALTNGGFKAASQRFGADKVEGIQSVWRVLAVFAFVPVFWSLWDQSQSEWVVQAKKMDLNWLGIKWEAEQISFVNAAFILMFIPFFSFLVYPLLRRVGIKVTPLRKIGAGLVLTALSFVIVATIQEWIDAGQTPNISWQILAFVVLTAGEVLVSITCLEYAYTQAPPSMKSTIMACYLLSVTLGNVLVSVIQTSKKNSGFFAQFHGAGFFWLFTGICAGTAVLFMLVSPFIKERSYLQEG
jgi:proton-dependent oligopeptide transporter, POT family